MWWWVWIESTLRYMVASIPHLTSIHYFQYCKGAAISNLHVFVSDTTGARKADRAHFRLEFHMKPRSFQNNNCGIATRITLACIHASTLYKLRERERERWYWKSVTLFNVRSKATRVIIKWCMISKLQSFRLLFSYANMKYIWVHCKIITVDYFFFLEWKSNNNNFYGKDEMFLFTSL